MDKTGSIIEANVLVIGGGFAGLWAAHRASEFTTNVVVVEKAKIGSSGCSTFASGVQLCPIPGDDFDLWKKEIVEAGDYLPDQDWVDFFLLNQVERIRDYERMGAPLERDEKGSIARVLGRGHINTRNFQFRGRKLIETLREAVRKRGIKFVERVMITDLLTSDGVYPTAGCVTGAVGIGTRTAEFYTFKAGVVVLAAGPFCGKHSNVEDVDTGDGVAAAFRAGAELANMEFCTTGNIRAWERKAGVGGINMIQGHGAHIVNTLGERFMPQYDPVLEERSPTYRLGPAFAKEAMEGRGPIYVDMRHFAPSTFEKFRRVIPRTMQIWDSLGIDPAKQKLECTPMVGVRSTSGQGGIKIDLNCATNIPGLFAAGAVTRNPVQSIGGSQTASCNVLGFVAGEKAAKYSEQGGPGTVDPTQVTQARERALAPLKRKEGLMPSELFASLDRSLVPARLSMFKSEGRIIQALSIIERIKEKSQSLAAPDAHELVKANEFRNYVLCAELVFRAALERKESRQYHYREDYPYRDDINWLKLIVIRRHGQGIALNYEPIPLHKWAVKPDSFGKISHPVQMFLGE